MLRNDINYMSLNVVNTNYIEEAKIRSIPLTRNEKTRLSNIKVPMGKISETVPTLTYPENIHSNHWSVEFYRIPNFNLENTYRRLYVYFLYILVLITFIISINFRCEIHDDYICHHNKISFRILGIFLFIISILVYNSKYE